MSDLSILISDRTFNLGDREIILSKPRWKDISQFIGLIEGLFDSYMTEKDDLAFAKKLLADGGVEVTSRVESILFMCLRKNGFDKDAFGEFLADLDYDRVLGLLFEAIEMNANFFKEGMNKIGVRPEAEVTEVTTPTGEK